MQRVIIIGVRNVLGQRFGGAPVRISHSSGRLIYEGVSMPNDDIVAEEQYDSGEGGYLMIRVDHPSCVPARARLVERTITSNILAAAYQNVTLYPMPQKSL